MGETCEACGASAAVITAGPFAGSAGMHDYCAHCSKNLCDACLASKRCRESPTGRHEGENVGEGSAS